jgi:hypothetical protein
MRRLARLSLLRGFCDVREDVDRPSRLGRQNTRLDTRPEETPSYLALSRVGMAGTLKGVLIQTIHPFRLLFFKTRWRPIRFRLRRPRVGRPSVALHWKVAMCCLGSILSY